MNKKLELVILGVMGFILVIAVSIQIKTVNYNGTTVNSNQAESNLKTQVLKMKEKYENQYKKKKKIEKELEKTREQATSNNTELTELQDKIKQDNILLGNTDVKGSGITVTLTDGKGDSSVLDVENLLVHAENVLAIVNEMKNAGAEAISINGQRLINTTAISCDGNVIVVNGEKISSPIEIRAIGLPELLSTLDRPGGTLEYFLNLGKVVDVKKYSSIDIPKYTGVTNFRYAKTVK